jgi:hypothetical protein
MSNKRRVAEKNLGLFLNPNDGASGAGFVVPMDNLNVGPGKPGPGDEWHVPTGPLDEIVAQSEASVEPVSSDGTVSLPPSSTRKP